jgi:toxin FitB
MMLILDTNVISALMRGVPEEPVARWLDSQPRTFVWTTSVTVFEIRSGLQMLAPSERRSRLLQTFEALLADKLGRRIAPFDVAAAEQAADLTAARRRKGRPGELRDTMIAGIALSCRATLATRNTSHFEDLSVPVVNPWDL